MGTQLQEPLISILMPFRNTESYLEECLRSVCEQSLPDWELLAYLQGNSEPVDYDMRKLVRNIR